jgi:uncharacterized protein
MKVYIKIHINPLSEVVAVCDESVLGKTFKSGELQISISESFYKGDLVEIEDVISILKNSSNFNLAGPNIIKASIEKGIIIEDSVLKINSIPLAMKFVL